MFSTTITHPDTIDQTQKEIELISRSQNLESENTDDIDINTSNDSCRFSEETFSVFLESLSPKPRKNINLTDSNNLGAMELPLLRPENKVMHDPPMLISLSILTGLTGWSYPRLGRMSLFVFYWRIVILLCTLLYMITKTYLYISNPSSSGLLSNVQVLSTLLGYSSNMIVQCIPILQSWYILRQYPFFIPFTRLYAFIFDEDRLDLSTTLPLSLKTKLRKYQRLAISFALEYVTFSTIFSFLNNDHIGVNDQIFTFMVLVSIPIVLSSFAIWFLFMIYCHVLRLMILRLTILCKNIILSSETAYSDLKTLYLKYSCLHLFLNKWNSMWSLLLLAIPFTLILYLQLISKSCPAQGIIIFLLYCIWLLFLSDFPARVSSSCTSFTDSIIDLNHRSCFCSTPVQKMLKILTRHVEHSQDTFGFVIFNFKLSRRHLVSIGVLAYSVTAAYFSLVYPHTTVSNACSIKAL